MPILMNQMTKRCEFFANLAVATGFIVFLCCIPCWPQTNEIPAKIEWMRYLGRESLCFKEAAVSMSPLGEILIVGKSRSLTNGEREATLLLWRVDLGGKLLQELEILENKNLYRIPCLAALGDGGAVIVGSSFLDQTYVFRIDKTGGLVSQREVPELKSNGFINRIAATADGGYLLVGCEHTDAFVMKLDRFGDEQWKRVFDRGQTEYFETAVPTEDGGCILIGDSGEYKGLLAKTSTVWIVRCDASGKKQLECVFPGRLASGCGFTNGRYLVVYDRNLDLTQDIRVRALDENLNELWDTSATTAKEIPTQFSLVPAPTGGFVLSGTRSLGLWLGRFDDNGKEVWHFLDTGPARSYQSLALVQTSTGVVACTSYLRVSPPMPPEFKIGLMMFRP